MKDLVHISCEIDLKHMKERQDYRKSRTQMEGVTSRNNNQLTEQETNTENTNTTQIKPDVIPLKLPTSKEALRKAQMKEKVQI